MIDRTAFEKFAADVEADADAAIEAMVKVKIGVRALVDALPEEPPVDPVPEVPTDPEPEDPTPEQPEDPAPVDPDPEVPSDPEPEPTPDPDPGPTPPPPANPKPPATNDDLVDGLRDGRTPCGARTPAAGMKVAGRDQMPAGIIVTQDRIIFDSFTGDFDDPDGWDFGDRQVLINCRFGAFNNWRSTNQIKRLIGKKGTTPGIWVKSGAGFDQMAYATASGSNAVMLLKQEQGAVVGEVTRCDCRGGVQDILKVCGSNLIHENLLGDGFYPGGTPHPDVVTVNSAEGDVVIRNNNIDWNWVNKPDQKYINNWFRIEVYPAYSGHYDDVIIEGNRLRHANPNSFGIQVTSKNNPVWVGSVKVRNNRMEKAGGLHKICYADHAQISEWTDNTDFAGNDIPYSAT